MLKQIGCSSPVGLPPLYSHSYQSSRCNMPPNEQGPEKKCRKNRSTSNPLLSSTEKCHVCHEPAARHIHYGAVTCFSCRAFFRRSIQNNAFNAYKCRKDNRCEINIKSRKNCQKCRFVKCLAMGMKSSWVLSEEERNRRFRKSREKKRCEPNTDGEARSENHQIPAARSDDNQMNLDLLTLNESDQSCCVLHGTCTCAQITVTAPVPPMAGHFDQDYSGLPEYHQQWPDASRPLNKPMAQHHHHHHHHHQQPPPHPQHEQHQERQQLYQQQQQQVSAVTACHSSPSLVQMPPPELISASEMEMIRSMIKLHDISYKSINFGEELIKEMVMSSVFGVPLSFNATMNAYRLMIQRVTRVAQGFEPFIRLPHVLQHNLLKHNSDMIVSLRGAVFFEKRKGGLDQILITMGVNDLPVVKTTVMAAMKSTQLKRIDYQTFNSIQKVEPCLTEERYNQLLSRIGSTVSFDPDVVKMLSYILLLSADCIDEDGAGWSRKLIEEAQEEMIHMLQRYLMARYSRTVAVKLLSGVLHCIGDLKELTWIKKQRKLSIPAQSTSDSSVL